MKKCALTCPQMLMRSKALMHVNAALDMDEYENQLNIGFSPRLETSKK